VSEEALANWGAVAPKEEEEDKQMQSSVVTCYSKITTWKWPDLVEIYFGFHHRLVLLRNQLVHWRLLPVIRFINSVTDPTSL